MALTAFLGEGARPIFARDEIIQGSRLNSGSSEEQRLVVAIVNKATPVETQGVCLFYLN